MSHKPVWLSIFIAVTAIVAISCSSGSSEVTETPLATQALGETPTATSGISAELATFLAEVDSKIASIRGIPVADPVPFQFLNSEELNAYVREQIDDQETRNDIELAEGLYALLGLIPADMDLFEAYSALLDAQVLGVYDPEAEEFAVLQRGDTFGPSQELTYAHEYVHRLQDARFGLDETTDELKENSDRSLAYSSLVEGDAVTSQQIYALQNFTFQELSEILTDSEDAVATADDAPYILRRGLEFPYIEGAEFADRLRTSMGLEALNAAFMDPPESTEQILHFEKFQADEQPVEVTLPDSLFSEGGSGVEDWELVDTDVLGEAFLKTWLEAIGAREQDAAEAAAGWGGDATHMARNADDDYALATKMVWDNAELDAQQFSLVFTTAMESSPYFNTLDVGPVGESFGVKAYEGDGGVIVTTIFSSVEHGEFTVVTAAPEMGYAMSLLLALAG